MRILDALADILLGSTCPGCQRPGYGLCEGCELALQGADLRYLPGGLEVIHCVHYSGVIPRLITAFKDEQCWSLKRPFAEAIAASVALVRADWWRRPALIVPAPSLPKAVRSRGFDHTWAIAKSLGHINPDWRPMRLLKAKAGADQAKLDQNSRWLNRANSFTARAGSGAVVLVDDLVTTGATLTSAAHALKQVGWTVIGAVTVANTPLRAGDSPESVRQFHNA